MTTSVDIKVAGTGTPVLLLPGGGSRCEKYFPLVDTLTDEATVVVYDRVGAEPGSPAPSLAEQASELRRVIETVDRGPALLVGHSFGGPVAVQLAADHPDVVASALLLDPTVIMDARMTRLLPLAAGAVGLVERTPRLRTVYATRTRKSVQHHYDAAQSPQVREALDLLLEPDQMQRASRRLRGFHRDAAALAARLRAGEVSIDGVVAVAAKSLPAMRRANVALSEAVGMELEVWEGSDHTMHIGFPDRMIATIRRQLADVRST
jgi:pimeloyl-ACP methyl ester carboxylesterase